MRPITRSDHADGGVERVRAGDFVGIVLQALLVDWSVMGRVLRISEAWGRESDEG